ncbi:helix-turn-helix domain-containing protein [Thermosulfurimonas sp. F29]|nr:helix-turn-helix domain-containing protein [Thermosulfurimonas sp. F29]
MLKEDLSVAEAARRIGVARRTIYRWLQQHGVRLSERPTERRAALESLLQRLTQETQENPTQEEDREPEIGNLPEQISRGAGGTPATGVPGGWAALSPPTTLTGFAPKNAFGPDPPRHGDPPRRAVGRCGVGGLCAHGPPRLKHHAAGDRDGLSDRSGRFCGYRCPRFLPWKGDQGLCGGEYVVRFGDPCSFSWSQTGSRRCYHVADRFGQPDASSVDDFSEGREAGVSLPGSASFDREDRGGVVSGRSRCAPGGQAVCQPGVSGPRAGGNG